MWRSAISYLDSRVIDDRASALQAGLRSVSWRRGGNPHPPYVLATLAANQRARPPKGFEAQSRKGSQGSRRRLKSAATVKSFSSAAHPNSLWHERAIKKIKPGHKKSNRDIRRCRPNIEASTH